MALEMMTHDCNGRPIEVGDVIKVFHFTHYLRRRKCYMYKVVTEHKGLKYLTCISELATKGAEAHKCILTKTCMYQKDVEIISGYGPNGGDPYDDRPKVKVELEIEEEE